MSHRSSTYRHAFVDTFPAEPEPNVLYVSVEFASTMHLCMCGCGEEVVAPLDPTDWTAHFDGRTVSLTPSIGNWSLKCQSHYFLTHGRVRWAARWSRAQIEAGRAQDRLAKQHLYETPEDASSPRPGAGRSTWLKRWWTRLRRG
jgi:hypothetical protein